LIAVEKDSLQVLTTTGLQSVPLAAARHIRLVGYETSAAQLTAWAILGGLSTPTHGWYLLFTAPAWAIGGVIAVRTEARAPVFHEAMTRFARLPQGLPKDFDPRSLGPLDSGVWHAPAATP
jgi:hypothetical protein